MYSPELIALARYMAGEFENKAQAMADPAWYVHLRFWQRPVPLFLEDSITLFAEQANYLYPNKTYRQRVLRLQDNADTPDGKILVRYYMFEDSSSAIGAGNNLDLLETITSDRIKLLPDCTLNVTRHPNPSGGYRFVASPPPDKLCSFTYRGEAYRVSLGFEANPDEFLSYDKGIEPETGRALWGAILGPYRFSKSRDFSGEIPLL